MSEAAIELPLKKELYVYSPSCQGLSHWLAPFAWQSSDTLAQIRQWLSKEHSSFLLIDLRADPKERIVEVASLKEHFSNAVIVCVLGETQLHWGQSCIDMGADAFMCHEHCNVQALQVQLHCLLKTKSKQPSLIQQLDPCTGLINQTLYLDRLKHALMIAARHQCHTGILLVQVDDYDSLANTHEAALNNALLVQMAKYLTSSIRNSDSLARIDQDVFAVLLEDLKDEVMVAHIAHKIQNQFANGIEVMGHTFNISVSIGGHLCESGESNAQALYMQASIALKHAIEHGKKTLWFYQQDLNIKTMARSNMEIGLTNALVNDQFFLQFQPNHTGKGFVVNGMHALLRWKHPTAGVVYPDIFMSLLENSGLIIDVGKWWIEHSIKQFKAWFDQGCISKRQQIFIDINEKQLRSEGFVEFIIHQLAVNKLDAQAVVLQVTENTALKNIGQLKSLGRYIPGICLAIRLTDFGKSYSSLTYLKEIDVDYVCLGDSLLEHIHIDHMETSVAKIIIDFTHTLGIEVMASGANNLLKVKKMQALGCDGLRGDYFSAPLYSELWPQYIHSSVS